MLAFYLTLLLFYVTGKAGATSIFTLLVILFCIFKKEIIAVKGNLKVPIIAKSRHVSMIPFLYVWDYASNLSYLSPITPYLSFILEHLRKHTQICHFSILSEADYTPCIVADAYKLSIPQTELPRVQGQSKIQSENLPQFLKKISSVSTFTPLMVPSIVMLASFKNWLYLSPKYH